uniref:Uncharacterized protein n=1 Tax=Anopheles stephensi TaxID=30069 RepID=A0A182YMP6_ANOST
MQQRLKSLSSELVTLRNRLHTGGQTTGTGPNGGGVPVGGGAVVSPTSAPNTTNTGSGHGVGTHGTAGLATHANNASSNNGLLTSTVGANGINVLPHLANGCPNNTTNNNNNNNSNNTTNNNINSNSNNSATNNAKNHMLVTSAAQCIPANQASNNLNASQHNVNVLPIVSPRNTSIPYPLPHHNVSSGTMLHGGE